MFKYVWAIVTLLMGSYSFAGVLDCSELPRQGNIHRTLRLSDGTNVTFKAKMTVERINSFKEAVISHRYDYPQVFVDNTEVAISVAGLDGIAKALGYDGLGFRDVQTNAGFFRKRQTLTFDGHSLSLVKSPKVSKVIATIGSAKLFHHTCAPWQF